MSRYGAIAKKPGFNEAVVGWDNPLQSFFATLYGPEDTFEFVVGTNCDSVAALVERTAGAVEIPSDVIARLERDGAARRPNTPIQEFMRRQLNKNS